MEETRANRHWILATIVIAGLAATGLLAPLAAAQETPDQVCTPENTPTLCIEIVPKIQITPVTLVEDPGPGFEEPIAYAGFVKFCRADSSFDVDGNCDADDPAATLLSAGTSNPPCHRVSTGIFIDCEDNDLIGGDDEQALRPVDHDETPLACLWEASLTVDVNGDGENDFGPFPATTVTQAPCS